MTTTQRSFIPYPSFTAFPDLDLYLAALGKAKRRYSLGANRGDEQALKNDDLLNKMADEAIYRFYNAVECPTCGNCNRECDNCAFCNTDSPDQY